MSLSLSQKIVLSTLLKVLSKHIKDKGDLSFSRGEINEWAESENLDIEITITENNILTIKEKK